MMEESLCLVAFLPGSIHGLPDAADAVSLVRPQERVTLVQHQVVSCETEARVAGIIIASDLDWNGLAITAEEAPSIREPAIAIVDKRR